MKRPSPRWLIAGLLFLSLLGSFVPAAVNGQWRVNLLKGTSTLATEVGATEAEAWANCAKRIAAMPAGATTYTCQTPRYVATVIADPPVVCTAPQPADELRAMECPNTDTRWWNQERTYVAAPYPTCWMPTEWQPSAPRSDECVIDTPEVPDAIYVKPGESISAATARLKPGGTVIVKPGTYAAFSLKACAMQAWCTVRAEIDGTVNVTGLSIGAGAWFTSIEGMKFTGSSQKAVTGSYVKLKRNAFVGGPLSGNNVIVQIGTNDRTPGAEHILLEDSWVYGPGGRYKVLVYNSANVVLRRVVTRTDAGYRNSDGAPEADITVYDSRNVEVQNAIALDGQGTGAYVAVFYNALNGAGNSTRAWRGCIAINGSGYYMGTEGQTNITDLLVEDGAAIGGTYGISQLKGTGNLYRRLTLLNSRGDGFGIFGGSASITDSIVAGHRGAAFNKASCSTCLTTAAGLKSLLEPVNGKGATILKRIGVSGTLHGEPGFGEVTDESLWPWPNEARIKADFDEVRPAFGGKSLTEYVQGQRP